MATNTELTQDQKTWVVRITHVLGTNTPSSNSSTDGKLNLGEVKVSFVDADAATDKARRERSRALIVPREHGAWGLLLVPLVTGAGVALRESSNLFPFVLLLTAALTLFWVRTPLESLLGISAMRAETKDERQSTMFAVLYLGTVALLSLSMLLWGGHNPLLWPIGATATFFFAAQALLKIMWRRPPRKPALSAVEGSRDGEAERPRSKHQTQRLRMLSEVVGTIGLTLSAPAAYYVITGKLDATGWILWIANLVFAGDQIHYVQLRIHTARVEGLRAKLARGWAFAAGQAIMTVGITIACLTGLLPKYASLAFAPLLFRGWFYFVQKPAPLAVRKLGWSELTQAIAFCLILIGTLSVAK
jgi:hypothetical protein